MKKLVVIAAVGFLILSTAAEAGYDRDFDAGSLIIPMDLAYQDHGMFQAYGLLFQLLRQGTTVYWVIENDKTWHDAPCDTAGDECAWDCHEEGSGVKCPYPTASPDFYASAQVVWDGEGVASPGDPINLHGYRAGPFMIDSADRDAALAIIDVWNDPATWGSNPWADRSVFEVVTVHEATATFTGYVRKEMVAAPTIAVFADGNEDIATSYLRAAGIPQSNGNEFPAAKCGAANCGPGTDNPDMLTVPSIMGDMGTCDNPNYDHQNGALFTPDGVPAYCQIMTMHWDVKDRETVECDGGGCPATQAECIGETFTYHGHEVVAEVRQFLQYPVHFFAECQAVNAYENTVPNPAWPFLDDAGRMGHYLTTEGNPPSCIDDNDCPGKDWVCEENWCDNGTRDCCQSKNEKEKGAGFLIADRPDSNSIQFFHPEIAYTQLDGFYGTVGGSEPAYNLSTFLQTEYKNSMDITFITGPNGPGDQDVWMTGYLDGQCWIGCDDDQSTDCDNNPDECTMGKVSYLGGHAYTTNVPLSGNAQSQGTRMFLNALFEADCVTPVGQPSLWLSLAGPVTLATQTLPAQATYTGRYTNAAPGIALDAVLTQVLPVGTSTADFEPGGMVIAGGVEWTVGSIGGQPGLPGDPPYTGTRWTDVSFADVGTYQLEVRLSYRVGVNTFEAAPFVLNVDVGCDDGVACTDDASAGGNCMFTPNDLNCPDDGLFCTGVEACDPVAGCISSGDPCPGTVCNTCNEADGNCFDPAGFSCNDDLFCNGTDTCDGAGSCLHSGDPCLGGTFCNEATDTCDGCMADGDCDDGIACTDDSCQGGSCVFAPNDSNCPDDGLYCSGPESCDPMIGCISGGDPCLEAECGHCNEADDNCFDPVGSSCEDGIYCNGTDTCDGAGTCVHSGDPCGAGLFCNEAGQSCDGCLQDADCDDGVVCTDDTCVAAACVFSPNDQNCPDDDVYCNGTELCNLLSDCMSSGDPCPGTECRTCYEAGRSCFSPMGTACDDGLYCNGVDTCDGAGACAHPGDPCAAAGRICDEANDACEDCVQNADCDDGVACTDDSCTAGACANTPNNALCPDDQTFCNGTESCDAQFGCISSGNPCPGSVCNTCDEAADNCFPAAGTDCDDALFCNGTDACDGAGSCLHSGNPCPAGQACNESSDTCIPCTVDEDCDDDLFCTGTESCDAVAGCVSSGDPCAAGETCNEADDICEAETDGGDVDGGADGSDGGAGADAGGEGDGGAGADDVADAGGDAGADGAADAGGPSDCEDGCETPDAGADAGEIDAGGDEGKVGKVSSGCGCGLGGDSIPGLLFWILASFLIALRRSKIW